MKLDIIKFLGNYVNCRKKFSFRIKFLLIPSLLDCKLFLLLFWKSKKNGWSLESNWKQVWSEFVTSVLSRVVTFPANVCSRISNQDCSSSWIVDWFPPFFLRFRTNYLSFKIIKKKKKKWETRIKLLNLEEACLIVLMIQKYASIPAFYRAVHTALRWPKLGKENVFATLLQQWSLVGFLVGKLR